MASSTFPTEQIAQCGVITHHVKMSETTCTTPYTCKQSQYELKRLVTPVGTLGRKATLFKMFGQPAFFEHPEEQGKTAKGRYFLVYKLYIAISHQILWDLVVAKLINNYESTIYKTIFLMAVIRNMSTDISNDRFGIKMERP